MGLFSKDIQTINDLFVHQLKDVYYAENQIVKNLPTMIEKVHDEALKQGLSKHLEETENHVRRLEQVFGMYGVQPAAVDCPAMDGIIDEAEEVSGEIADSNVLDAGITAAAQAIEHYEIARYGTLVAWAKRLGREDCANILHQTLEEEKAADKKLTEVAESHVNRRAA